MEDHFLKIWKKNVIAAAVLVTVCAGIYMNWMYTNAENVEQTQETEVKETVNK